MTFEEYIDRKFSDLKDSSNIMTVDYYWLNAFWEVARMGDADKHPVILSVLIEKALGRMSVPVEAAVKGALQDTEEVGSIKPARKLRLAK